MTFHAAPGTVAMVFSLAVVAMVSLAWGEWRRPDRRRLKLRLGAILLAILGLTLLGLRPARQTSRSSAAGHGTEASLFTPVLHPANTGAPATAAIPRFALPTAQAAPKDAIILPDVSALRRRLPQVGTLHVYGDGLEPFDLDALRGLRIVFLPPDPARLPAPAIVFLHAPRELPLGTPLEIQGRVNGLPPGETSALALVNPDGSTTDARTSPADRDGAAAFTVRATAPPAAGSFDWRLRLTRGHDTLSDDPLGITVTRPNLPRVLVLESTPRFDTTVLRRWFEQAGGTLTARTQVGKGLSRFFGTAGQGGSSPHEFAALDSTLLTGFDLVLADARSLLALKDGERAALNAAITGMGLGLLTLADDAVLPSAPNAETAAAKSPAAALLPWTLQPVDTGAPAADNADRTIRVRWPGMEPVINTPVAAAPWEIRLRAGQSALVRDDQGRAVAATVPLGRGWLALTLVQETGRWNRTDAPAAFAAYWSHLFSETVRRDEVSGRWTLVGGDAGPMRVDEPLELSWQGPPGTTPTPAQISDETGETASLPLIGDPTELGGWRGKFWPRRPGWHRVSLPGGAPFDFRVDPPGSWPALAAARRRTATARFATESVDRAAAPMAEPDAAPVPLGSGWWFGLFLLGAGTLWAERRLAAGGSSRFTNRAGSTLA